VLPLVDDKKTTNRAVLSIDNKLILHRSKIFLYNLLIGCRNVIAAGKPLITAARNPGSLKPDMPKLSPPPSSFGGFSPGSSDLGLFFVFFPEVLLLHLYPLPRAAGYKFDR
jgi:hypothetical protein